MDEDIPNRVAQGPRPRLHRALQNVPLQGHSQRARHSTQRRHLLPRSMAASATSMPTRRESLIIPGLPGPLAVPLCHAPPPAHSRSRGPRPPPPPPPPPLPPPTQAGILGKFQKVIPVAAGPPRQDLRDAPLDLSYDSSSCAPPPAHGKKNSSGKQRVGQEVASSSSVVEAPLDLSVKKRPASRTESLFRPEPVAKKVAMESFSSDKPSQNVSSYDATTSSGASGGGGPRQGYESLTWVSFGKPKATPVGIATATAHSYEKLNNPNIKSSWTAPLPPAPGPSKNTSPLDGIPLSTGAMSKVARHPNKSSSSSSSSSTSSSALVPPARRRSPILPVGKYAVTSTEHPPEVVNVRGKAFKVSTVRPQVNGQPVITSKSYPCFPSSSASASSSSSALVSHPFTVVNTSPSVATMGVNATIGSGPLACLQLNSVARLGSVLSSATTATTTTSTMCSSKPHDNRQKAKRDESVPIEVGKSSAKYELSTSSSSSKTINPSNASSQNKDSSDHNRDSSHELDYQAPLLNIPKFRPSKKKSKKSSSIQLAPHIPNYPPETIDVLHASVPRSQAPGEEDQESSPTSPACVSISTQTIEPQVFNYPPPDEPVNFNDLYPKPSRIVMCARKSTTKPSKRLLQQYLELRSPTKSVISHGKKGSSGSSSSSSPSSSAAMEALTSSPNLPSPDSRIVVSSPSFDPLVGDGIKQETNSDHRRSNSSSNNDKQFTDNTPSLRTGSAKREGHDGFTKESKGHHSVNKAERSASSSKSVGTDTEWERTSHRSHHPSSSSSSTTSASARSIVLPSSQLERGLHLALSKTEKSASSSSSSSSPAQHPPSTSSSTVKSIFSSKFEPLVINMDEASSDSQASSSCSSSVKSGVSKCSALAPEADTGRLLAQLLVAKHKQGLRTHSPAPESPHFLGRNSPKVEPHIVSSTHMMPSASSSSSAPSSDADLEVEQLSSGGKRVISRPRARHSRSSSSDNGQGNIFENIQAMAQQNNKSAAPCSSDPEMKDELSLMCFEEMSPESAPPSPVRDTARKPGDNSEISFNRIFNRKIQELSSDAESKDIPEDTAAKGVKSELECPTTKCYPKVANLSAFISTIENKLVPLHYATIRESIYAPVARTTSPVPIENTRFYQANILRGSLNRSTSSSALESMNTGMKLEPPAHNNSDSAASTPAPSPTPEEEDLEDWQREHIRYKRHKLRMPRELIALPKNLRKGSAAKRLSPEGLYDYSPSSQYGKAKACISTDSHTPVLTPIRSLSTTNFKGLARLANLDASLLHTAPKSFRTVADFQRAKEAAAASSTSYPSSLSAPDLSKEFETDPMETWTMVKEVSPRKPVSPAAACGGKESSGTLVTVLRRERSRDDSGSSKSPVPFSNRRKSIDAPFLLAKPSNSKQQDLEPTESSHSAATAQSDIITSPKPKLTFTYNEGKPFIKISHSKKKSSKSSKPEKHRRFSYTIKGDHMDPPSEPLDPCSPPPKLSPIRLIASPPRKGKKSSKKSDTPPADTSCRLVQTGNDTIPDLSPVSPDPLHTKVKFEGKSDIDEPSPNDNVKDDPKPKTSAGVISTPNPVSPPPSQEVDKDSEDELIDVSPPKIPKLEPEILLEVPTTTSPRSPIKMTLKSKEVLSESDSCLDVKDSNANPSSNYIFPSSSSVSVKEEIGTHKEVSEAAPVLTKSPSKTSSSSKSEKKSKKGSKKHKKNKRKDGSKERSKDSVGKKIKKESSVRDGAGHESHKVKKSSKKKKKSDKRDNGESKKKSSSSSSDPKSSGKVSEKSRNRQSKSSKERSEHGKEKEKEKSKKKIKKEKSAEGETSAERKRRYHKRMKARNLGKKIKQAVKDREEEQKRKKKRRSLLDELTNSDGYVAEKRLEAKKSKDLFADPSKLGREERALLRAMMQFSEMEQVTEIDSNDDKVSEAECSKRQDQTSAVRKAQALRKSALKRARSKIGVSARKKFDDFVPEILSTRTRRQTAEKRTIVDEPLIPKEETPSKESASDQTSEQSEKQEANNCTEGEKGSVGNPSDHSGRWEILSDDDQKPSPQVLKSQVSPASALTLTIQWKPRSSDEKEEVLVKPEPVSKKCKTPESKRRRSRSRRNLSGFLGVNVGDEEHHPADLKNYPLDLDISLANLREQMCAPSPVPSVTSYTTVSTSCTDELPIPECVKKMSVNQNTGETILHKAARLGYEDVARFCAQTEYLDLDARDHAGYTAMHECCSQGHLEVTRLLIDGGASVNIPSCDGMRPLHDSVENDLMEMVRLLLSRGADPKVATYSGKTVLGLTSEKPMLNFLTGHFQDLNGCRQPQPEIPWPFYGSSVCEDYDELSEGQGMDALAEPPEDDVLEDLDAMFEFSEGPMIATYFLPLDPVKGATNYVLLDDVTDRLKTTPEAFLQEHFTVVPHHSAVDYITSCCACLCPATIDRLKAVSEKSAGDDRVRLVEYTDVLRNLLASHDGVVVDNDDASKLKPDEITSKPQDTDRQMEPAGLEVSCETDVVPRDQGLTVNVSDTVDYDWNEQFLLGTRGEEDCLGLINKVITPAGQGDSHLQGEEAVKNVDNTDMGVPAACGGGDAANAIYKGLFLQGESEEGEDEEDFDEFAAMCSTGSTSSLPLPNKNDDDIHFKKPY